MFSLTLSNDKYEHWATNFQKFVHNESLDDKLKSPQTLFRLPTEICEQMSLNFAVRCHELNCEAWAQILLFDKLAASHSGEIL